MLEELRPYLFAASKQELPTQFARWPLSQVNGEIYAGALLEWQAQPDAAALARLGVRASEAAGGIQPARVPLRVLEELLATPGLDRVQITQRGVQQLDTARAEVGGDTLHLGLDLPRPFTGQGVVVGVVDGGFDYTHPAFRLADTGELRVSRAWHQRAIGGGRPPSRYDYGVEVTGAEALLAARHDLENLSHGSHVANIAAGAGFGPEASLRGMAPDAELVFVSTDFSEAGIADGVAYIFRYAQSVGKPAVVNVSIGGRIGPRDGSSPFDRYVESIVRPGYFLVGASGNSGRLPNHLHHDFSRDTVRTVVGMSGESGILDCWTGLSGRMEGRILLYDGQGEPLHAFQPISTADNVPFASDTLTFGSDYFILLRGTSSFARNTNRKGRIQYRIQTNDRQRYFPVLELWADGGETHCWHNDDNFIDTLRTGYSKPEWTRGDTLYTINEIGGTGRRTFTVGAYTITTSYETLTQGVQSAAFPGPHGSLGRFSSRGPSVDGRVKPELTAPGNSILSALSSADPGYSAAQTCVEYLEGDKRWLYGYQHGTSMAAPFVTGTVALLLQINPRLSYDEIATLLMESARADEFTGVTGEDNTDWGFGKLNALQAVLDLLDSPLDRNAALSRALPVVAYPNPIAGASVNLAGLNERQPTVCRWHDAQGRLVMERKLEAGVSQVAAPQAAGFYVLEVTQDERVARLRLVAP